MTAGADLETILADAGRSPDPRVPRHQGSSSTVYWRVEVTPWTSAPFRQMFHSFPSSPQVLCLPPGQSVGAVSYFIPPLFPFQVPSSASRLFHPAHGFSNLTDAGQAVRPGFR